MEGRFLSIDTWTLVLGRMCLSRLAGSQDPMGATLDFQLDPPPHLPPGLAQCSPVSSVLRVWSAIRATAATSPSLGLLQGWKIPSPLCNTVFSGINPWAVRDNALTETSPFINRARGRNKLPAWEDRVTFRCSARFLE